MSGLISFVFKEIAGAVESSGLIVFALALTAGYAGISVYRNVRSSKFSEKLKNPTHLPNNPSELDGIGTDLSKKIFSISPESDILKETNEIEVKLVSEHRYNVSYCTQNSDVEGEHSTQRTIINDHTVLSTDEENFPYRTPEAILSSHGNSHHSAVNGSAEDSHSDPVIDLTDFQFYNHSRNAVTPKPSPIIEDLFDFDFPLIEDTPNPVKIRDPFTIITSSPVHKENISSFSHDVIIKKLEKNIESQIPPNNSIDKKSDPSSEHDVADILKIDHSQILSTISSNEVNFHPCSHHDGDGTFKNIQEKTHVLTTKTSDVDAPLHYSDDVVGNIGIVDDQFPPTHSTVGKPASTLSHDDIDQLDNIDNQIPPTKSLDGLKSPVEIEKSSDVHNVAPESLSNDDYPPIEEPVLDKKGQSTPINDNIDDGKGVFFVYNDKSATPYSTYNKNCPPISPMSYPESIKYNNPFIQYPEPQISPCNNKPPVDPFPPPSSVIEHDPPNIACFDSHQNLSHISPVAPSEIVTEKKLYSSPPFRESSVIVRTPESKAIFDKLADYILSLTNDDPSSIKIPDLSEFDTDTMNNSSSHRHAISFNNDPVDLNSSNQDYLGLTSDFILKALSPKNQSAQCRPEESSIETPPINYNYSPVTEIRHSSIEHPVNDFDQLTQRNVNFDMRLPSPVKMDESPDADCCYELENEVIASIPADFDTKTDGDNEKRNAAIVDPLPAPEPNKNTLGASSGIPLASCLKGSPSGGLDSPSSHKDRVKFKGIFAPIDYSVSLDTDQSGTKSSRSSSSDFSGDAHSSSSSSTVSSDIVVDKKTSPPQKNIDYLNYANESKSHICAYPPLGNTLVGLSSDTIKTEDYSSSDDTPSSDDFDYDSPSFCRDKEIVNTNTSPNTKSDSLFYASLNTLASIPLLEHKSSVNTTEAVVNYSKLDNPEGLYASNESHSSKNIGKFCDRNVQDNNKSKTGEEQYNNGAHYNEQDNWDKNQTKYFSSLSSFFETQSPEDNFDVIDRNYKIGNRKVEEKIDVEIDKFRVERCTNPLVEQSTCSITTQDMKPSLSSTIPNDKDMFPYGEHLEAINLQSNIEELPLADKENHCTRENQLPHHDVILPKSELKSAEVKYDRHDKPVEPYKIDLHSTPESNCELLKDEKYDVVEQTYVNTKKSNNFSPESNSDSKHHIPNCGCAELENDSKCYMEPRTDSQYSMDDLELSVSNDKCDDAITRDENYDLEKLQTKAQDNDSEENHVYLEEKKDFFEESPNLEEKGHTLEEQCIKIDEKYVAPKKCGIDFEERAGFLVEKSFALNECNDNLGERSDEGPDKLSDDLDKQADNLDKHIGDIECEEVDDLNNVLQINSTVGELLGEQVSQPDAAQVKYGHDFQTPEVNAVCDSLQSQQISACFSDQVSDGRVSMTECVLQEQPKKINGPAISEKRLNVNAEEFISTGISTAEIYMILNALGTDFNLSQNVACSNNGGNYGNWANNYQGRKYKPNHAINNDPDNRQQHRMNNSNNNMHSKRNLGNYSVGSQQSNPQKAVVQDDREQNLNCQRNRTSNLRRPKQKNQNTFNTRNLQRHTGSQQNVARTNPRERRSSDSNPNRRRSSNKNLSKNEPISFLEKRYVKGNVCLMEDSCLNRAKCNYLHPSDMKK